MRKQVDDPDAMTRSVTRFLWFPLTLKTFVDNTYERRWLERAKIVQRKCGYNTYDISYWLCKPIYTGRTYEWEDVRWAEC